jgi:hypothetical protein
MVGSGAGIKHPRSATLVVLYGTYRFVHIKNKVWILDEVDPEPEGKTVGLPRVDDLKNLNTFKV